MPRAAKADVLESAARGGRECHTLQESDTEDDPGASAAEDTVAVAGAKQCDATAATEGKQNQHCHP
jgi:hypothetical protein